MTLYKVIETIKMLSLKHPNVNSAHEGSIYEIMNANPQQKYASVVLTQQSHSQDENYDHYNFNIFYVDRLVDDMESNRVQIQSTGKSILSNIIKAFCEEFDAECENITFNTFTERFADECAGVYVTITIDMLKDIYCTEKYWDGNWSAPVISIKNQNKKVEFTENGVYTIDYDSTLYTGLGKVEVEVNVEDSNGSYEEGYTKGLGDGIADGIYHQKSKLESINITENGVYTKEDGYDEITVNVIDTNGSYEDGYLDGETDGYNDGLADGIGEGRSYQKSLLESITITENGTYTKEDGYNQITVNIEDVNGSYSEGYEDGIENAGEIIAENAQVLNITESGIYTTKYTKDEDVQVTGYFDDGTPFYNYLLLLDKSLKTDVTLNSNSNIELWWKPDFNIAHEYTEKRIISLDKDTWVGDIILGYNTPASASDSEKIFLQFDGLVYTYNKKITDKWYHIVISFDDGFFVDGEKVGDLNLNWDITQDYVYINHSNLINSTNNGYYGMVKVDCNIYIPTVNGYINYNTNTPLESVYNGSFVYYEGLKGTFNNLIRTVNVDVAPKINVLKENIKFGYCNFSEIPEYYDFDGVTNLSYMFYYCSKLKTIPQLDTINVTNMMYMFYYCVNLETIPQLNTINVTNMMYMFYDCDSLETIPQLNTINVTNMTRMFYSCGKLKTIPQLNTINVTDMTYMFYGCGNLETIPQLDTSKVTNMNRIFYNCSKLKSVGRLNANSISNTSTLAYIFGTSNINTLTDFGGLINLKTSWNDNYGLKLLPNLTYESCINVLNGLYDFTGNNQTPSSSQGNLKVHANFLTTVGDEISIGTNKGWTITA